MSCYAIRYCILETTYGIKMIQCGISDGLNERNAMFPHKIFTKRHGIQQTAGQRTK